MSPSAPRSESGTLPAAAPARARAEHARAVLEARGVVKSFAVGKRTLEVLHGVDCALHAGERLALVGASGAGKSTLLHVLGLLERPDAGAVLLDGRDGWALSQVERGRVRNREIGFVFQFYHLMPELDAVENVLLPAMVGRTALGFLAQRGELRDRARGLLESFGLAERLRHRPSQLSGGERQRVALARALFPDPPILIADEPTGNLDSATGAKVLELLFAEQARREFALLLVTHDRELAARCQRTLTMHDGRIVEGDAPASPAARRG
jgi:predicted ABC-type transport system involved in lysophospholipase L1 biosynthesis ATPase subunit